MISLIGAEHNTDIEMFKYLKMKTGIVTYKY